MPTIIFSSTAQLQQVEDFPSSCKRSVDGALHVRPGATCVVTDQEALHLNSKGIKFSVSGRAKPVPLSKAATDPAPAPTATAKALLPRPATPFDAAPSDGSGEPEQK